MQRRVSVAKKSLIVNIPQTKIIPKTEAVLELSTNDITPKFDYLFNLDGKLYSRYTMTTAMLSIVWAPFSNFMQTPTGRTESDKRFRLENGCIKTI